MRTVYKYPLTLGKVVEHDVLANGKVVHVGLDPNGEACVWWEGSTEATIREWFYIHGTGHEVGPFAKHVGAFVDAPFVWHVYSVGSAYNPSGGER